MKKRKKDHRLNMRLAAGVVILTGAAVLGTWHAREDVRAPSTVSTLSAAMSACNKNGIQTGLGRLGCTRKHGMRQGGSVTFLTTGARD